MNSKHALTEHLANLQSWRYGLGTQVTRVGDALSETGFLSSESEAHLTKLTSSIAAERVTIAFIAEYMRGKSELINALFFADLGRRLLPSGPGKTTRCVTELRFDREVKTGVKLLPIETRESARPFNNFYTDESQWRNVLFDADNPDSMARALAALSETKRISVADAVAWGLHGEVIGMPANATDKNAESAIVNRTDINQIVSASGAFVDVPRWRYAIINFPHPLLDAGLVIIDTPGLATFLTESEIARERLANADALLLILDINAGVAKPDLTLWKTHFAGNRSGRKDAQERVRAQQNDVGDNDQARIIVLNKIDEVPATPVKTPEAPVTANRELLREIDRRVRDTADLLRVDPISVVPVSAKLGLSGALENNTDKILRSRLYQLLRSLASELPRNRQNAQTAHIIIALSNMIEAAQETLDQARYQALTGLSNLGVVRKKNEKMMTAIVTQTNAKQDRLEATFKELRGIKGVHSKLAEELAAIVDVAAAKADINRARAAIAGSVKSSTAIESCNQYLTVTAKKLDAIQDKISEIRTLFSSIGQKMREEFGLGGLEQFDAHPFATHRFQTELDKAREKAVSEFAKTSNLLTRRGAALADQFEDVVADRVLNIFKIAQRESATWMRGLYNSQEKPLAELKIRMEQRSTSVDKVKGAELDLAERIAELQAEIDVIKRRHETLAEARAGLARYAGARPDDSAT